MAPGALEDCGAISRSGRPIQFERLVAVDQAVRLHYPGGRHRRLAEYRPEIAQTHLAAGRNQLRAEAVRQHRDALLLECSGTEDGFLAGMRKDRKTDRLLRDAPDRRDYLLTFAVGDSGIHYDDAARAGDKGDVCCASTIFRGDSAAGSRQNVHARSNHDGAWLRCFNVLGRTKRRENADERLTKEARDCDASARGKDGERIGAVHHIEAPRTGA